MRKAKLKKVGGRWVMVLKEDNDPMEERKTMRVGGRDVKIIQNNDDLMLVIIECPNCGEPTLYGQTRMISGFVGCDNDNCYFGDLQPRVLKIREENYEQYRKGENIYRKERMRKS